MPKKFRILIGSDGSRPAQAALAAASVFPWPEPARARGVVALGASSWLSGSKVSSAAVVRALHAQADDLRRSLLRRWTEAEVVELHEPAGRAILSEARRFSADAIVLGWRGHGAFRRLLAGSTSREVVARAPCPVLVARAAPARVRRIIVGFDGRPGARRAVRFVSRLRPSRGTAVVLVSVAEPPLPPVSSRVPRPAREALRAEIARINERRMKQARRKLDAAAAVLRRSGWDVRLRLRVGAPLARLLDEVAAEGGDILAVGARATSGLARALIGSVAAGALDRSPVPVLIVP